MSSMRCFGVVGSHRIRRVRAEQAVCLFSWSTLGPGFYPGYYRYLLSSSNATLKLALASLDRARPVGDLVHEWSHDLFAAARALPE